MSAEQVGELLTLGPAVQPYLPAGTLPSTPLT